MLLVDRYFLRGFSASRSFQPPADWTVDILWQP